MADLPRLKRGSIYLLNVAADADGYRGYFISFV